MSFIVVIFCFSCDCVPICGSSVLLRISPYTVYCYCILLYCSCAFRVSVVSSCIYTCFVNFCLSLWLCLYLWTCLLLWFSSLSLFNVLYCDYYYSRWSIFSCSCVCISTYPYLYLYLYFRLSIIIPCILMYVSLSLYLSISIYYLSINLVIDLSVCLHTYITHTRRQYSKTQSLKHQLFNFYI